MATKYFNAGSALMAVFIFFITGLFSWFGNTAVSNREQSIKTVQVLSNLDKTLVSINSNIQHLNSKIEKVSDKEIENEKKLYKLFVDIHKNNN